MRALRSANPLRRLHDFSTRRRRVRPGGDRPTRRSLRFETLDQRRLLTAASRGGADLIYDPTTGNLTMDTTGVESGYVVGYSIESDGGFREENAVKPFNGALIARDNVIALLSLDHVSGIYHSGVFDLGDVAPIGLSLEGLSEFLVAARYGAEGSDPFQFNLLLAGHAGARPSAESDVATGSESTPLVVDVLANDTSPNGESLTIQRVSIAQGRGEVFVQDNQIFYDPRGSYDYLRAGKQAQVEIVYSASNGLAMDVATLMVTITGENDVPLVGDDTVTIGAADAVADITAQLLSNDSDPDNDRMLAVTALDTTGTRGIVTRRFGRVYYDPAGRFDDLSFGETATDTFQYQVTDRDGAVATGTVTVVITGTSPAVDGGNNDDLGAPVDHEFIEINFPNIIEFNPEWADQFFGGDARQPTPFEVEYVEFTLFPWQLRMPSLDVRIPSIDVEIATPFADFFVASKVEPVVVLAGPHDTTQDAALLSILQVVRSNFGQKDATRADGDLDGDGVVQFSDILILASKFSRELAQVVQPPA